MILQKFHMQKNQGSKMLLSGAVVCSESPRGLATDIICTIHAGQ